MARKHIFESLREMQDHYPFQDTMAFADLKPAMKIAERTFLLEEIDSTTWSQILTEIDSPTGDTWTELADRVSYAAAQLTARLHMDKANVMFSSAGLLVANTQNAVPASEARTNALRLQLTRDVQIALDQVIQHLEANTAIFTDWAASDQRKKANDLIIRTATEFNAAHPIDNNRWIFRQMIAIQRQVIDTQIAGTIGKEFLTAYITELNTGILGPDYLEIRDRLHRAIAHLTVAGALPALQMKFGPDGIAIFDSFNQPITARRLDTDGDRMKLLRDMATENGLQELRKLEAYLNANASDTKYKAYFDSDKYINPQVDVTEINEDGQKGFLAI